MKKTKIERLRDLAIKKINMQLPKRKDLSLPIPKKNKATSQPKTIRRDIDIFMKKLKIDRIWKSYCKSLLQEPNAQVRLGSKRIQAKNYLNIKKTPILPIKQLSKEVIFEGWMNRNNNVIAKNIINQDSSLSFQELLVKMIMLMEEDIDYPYIWWIGSSPDMKSNRVIYQDSDGDNFVKLNNKWQMTYSIKSVGSLVGRQGGKNYEDMDSAINSYFVVWDNEDSAKIHSN